MAYSALLLFDNLNRFHVTRRPIFRQGFSRRFSSPRGDVVERQSTTIGARESNETARKFLPSDPRVSERLRTRARALVVTTLPLVNALSAEAEPSVHKITEYSAEHEASAED